LWSSYICYTSPDGIKFNYRIKNNPKLIDKNPFCTYDNPIVGKECIKFDHYKCRGVERVCHETCLKCNGATERKCLTCTGDRYYYDFMRTCVLKCPEK